MCDIARGGALPLVENWWCEYRNILVEGEAFIFSIQVEGAGLKIQLAAPSAEVSIRRNTMVDQKGSQEEKITKFKRRYFWRF